jgi:hypothetical protein
MPDFAPALIVFEKAPRWESELKRRFAASEVLVRPCRDVPDALALCRQARGSVVVAELCDRPADVLRLLESLWRKRVEAAPVVIAPTELADLEWPARESGAAAFVTDRVGGAALSDICRRLLRSSTSDFLV